MEGPIAKRPRRAQGVPAERAGTRQLAQDTASPPENKRSRKRANLVAEELLASGVAVDDEAVLTVLRSFKFSENTNRPNVAPAGAPFVLSDTFGLVSTRTGAVSVSRLTRRHPAVVRLLSAWVKRAWPSSPCFPFTSISVNYGYAARMHRDANNVGPSLTRSFGDFVGGRLRYWGEDDGSLALEELARFPATVLDTGRALCLFDGRRCHSVESFTGERYSLVFFCTNAYGKARGDALALLSSLGAHVPTSSALRQAARYLCPAKGYELGRYQRDLRQMCGEEIRPTCVIWSRPSLLSVNAESLDKCLSFVIAPQLMSTLCAVAKAISAAAHRPSSWSGTIVYSAERRPAGKVAMTHFKSWSLAKAVVGGSWERGSLTFIVNKTWVAWAFVHLRGTKNVLVSRFPVPSADAMVMFSIDRVMKSKVLVGIAKTNTSGCQSDVITSALEGRPSQGAVVVAAVLSSAKGKAFKFNNKPFGPSSEPIKELRGIVHFSVIHTDCVAIAVPGRHIITADTPKELPDTASCHFFVVLPSSLEVDSVRPCWARHNT